jgi:two-component system cell cycle response regulator
VLFLIERRGGSDGAAGLELGPQSYLPKPCDPVELSSRIALALRTKATEDALARQARDANELSTTDLVTGIGDRRFMETRILELAATHGPAALATVVIFGIDDFEAVNDTFGHAVGDMVLRIVAGRLRRAAGDAHVLLCRWDSEEFLAVGVGLDATEATGVAERLRGAVSNTPFAIAADLAIPITLSAGCATGTLGVYAAVLGAATAALSEAKRAGGNQRCAAH